jgi:hypothetical protein
VIPDTIIVATVSFVNFAKKERKNVVAFFANFARKKMEIVNVNFAIFVVKT